MLIAQCEQLAAQQRGIEHRVVTRQRAVRKQESASARTAMQIVHDELGRREGCIEILPAAGYPVCLDQRRGAERSSHHRGGILRKQEKTACLPVEIVSPACAAVPVASQSEQQVGQLRNPCRDALASAQSGRELGTLPHQTIHVAVALQEQPYALGIVLLGHERQTPQIERETLEALNYRQPAQSRTLGQRYGAEYPGVESVVRVPALESLGLAVAPQRLERL